MQVVYAISCGEFSSKEFEDIADERFNTFESAMGWLLERYDIQSHWQKSLIDISTQVGISPLLINDKNELIAGYPPAVFTFTKK